MVLDIIWSLLTHNKHCMMLYNVDESTLSSLPIIRTPSMTTLFRPTTFVRHGLLALLSSLAMAGAHAAALDLSDCTILNGKKSAAAYKKWVSENQRQAEAGDQDAIRARAGATSNRLACLEEELTGDEGWGVVMTSGSGEDAVTQSSGPAGIANIGKHPVALKALKDRVKYLRQAGQFDPAYKSMAARTAAKYIAALPELIEPAYADAAGAYAVDCILKRKIGERSAATGCAMIRPTRAQLMTKVAPARRAILDAEADAWARQLPN